MTNVNKAASWKEGENLLIDFLPLSDLEGTIRKNDTFHNERIVFGENGNLKFFPGVTTKELQREKKQNSPGAFSVVEFSGIKKLIYDSQTGLDINTGYVVHGEAQLNFYRALHKDTAPILSINPLWLLVPAFTDFMEKHLMFEGLRTNIEKVGEEWLPKKQRATRHGQEYRENLVGQYDVMKRLVSDKDENDFWIEGDPVDGSAPVFFPASAFSNEPGLFR